MSHRLTITYRQVRVRAEGPLNHLHEDIPGRVADLEVDLHYVRDGALFYRPTGDPIGTEHMVPIDRLYHYSTGEEQG